MGQTIKELHVKAREAHDQYAKLMAQYMSETCTPSKKASLKLQLKTVKDRIVYFDKVLEDMINGEIISVTYLYNQVEAHGVFVNLSNEDIRHFYKLLSEVTKVDIQIKKIERSKTYVIDK